MEDAGAQGRTGEPGEGRPREVPSKFAFTQLFYSEDTSQRTDPPTGKKKKETRSASCILVAEMTAQPLLHC